jgi:phosphoglycolate phosphatase
MPVRRRQTLLLDLDGTLVDPAQGIIGSCRYAMERMGRPLGDDDDLRWIIGPPIRQTFARLLDGQGDPEIAVGHYRQRYSEWGLTAATPYDGVFEALAKRKEFGARLFLCTAKAGVFATRVVQHFGFHGLLDGVYGPDLDGRFEDKGDLIEHLVDREGLIAEDICMIGDREHDVLAANRNGIPTAGVLWGYGSPEELAAAGAEALIARPAELLD